MTTENTNIDNNPKNPLVIIHNRKELAAFLDSIVLKKFSTQSRGNTTALVKLLDFDVETHAEHLIPAHYAQLYSVVPLMHHNDSLAIAVDENTDIYDCVKNIEFITGHHVEAITADSKEIATMLERLYPAEDLIGLSESIDISSISNTPSVDDLRKQIEEKPLVELVKRIIYEAIKKNASDIHIKPTEDNIIYSLRIDGNMVFCSFFDKRYLNALVSRFKIIGSMNIAEHRLPQDGGAKITINNRTVEVRMSVIPTIYGESLVVRLLQTDKTLFTIEDLHLSAPDYNVLLKAMHQSNGLILACGPTGSGKSTTLYALLQEIKKDSTINIITAEDPVEFHINGIEQIQVNRKIDFTFAAALRNILRHDPNVIMIGEIRDEETAKIAIECALTGHLVLSTLHSIDSISTITRLLEMGVKPYLLKATLDAVIAQRLAKLNCPHCLGDDTSPIAERLAGDASLSHIHWKKSRGCRECNFSGLKGRRSIFEILEIDKYVSRSIQEGVTEDAIEAAATHQNMETLADKAQKMAEAGEISAAEYVRLNIG